MKRSYALITALALAAMLMTGCSEGDAAVERNESVEVLQAERGIPVRVTQTEKDLWVRWDEYSGTMSGYDEINVFGLLGDNYSKINISVGDIVKKGDILAEFPTNNPQANFNQAKIGYETVKKTYERMKRVYESGGISQQQLDEIEAQYRIAEQNFNSVKQLVTVISPASGVVVDIFFSQGDKNDPGMPMCKIVKANKLKTTIFIEESKISKYERGQEVEITWDGIKDRVFKGTINKISMSSNPAARGFSVEIITDNENEELMPGIFVYVRTPAYERDEAIAIPRDSYFTEGGKNYVYVAKNNAAQKRLVTLGEVIGGNVIVESGLSAGEKLISEGRTLLSDGAKIIVVE